MTLNDADSWAPYGWEPSDLGFDDAPFGSVLGDPLTGSPIFDVSVLDSIPSAAAVRGEGGSSEGGAGARAGASGASSSRPRGGTGSRGRPQEASGRGRQPLPAQPAGVYGYMPGSGSRPASPYAVTPGSGAATGYGRVPGPVGHRSGMPGAPRGAGAARGGPAPGQGPRAVPISGYPARRHTPAGSDPYASPAAARPETWRRASEEYGRGVTGKSGRSNWVGPLLRTIVFLVVLWVALIVSRFD